MVIFRNLISITENFVSRGKWAFKLPCDIARCSSSFYSTKADVDIPSPPKRPPTAYMVFCKENRPYVAKDNPGLNGPQLIKLLAEKWTSLEPSLKRPYEETARENTIVYGKLHKEFYESLTDNQRIALIKLKTEKKESKHLKKLKKALKVSGMPRLPSNAYTIFVQNRAKEIGVIKNGPNFIKQAAEEWKILPEDKRKVFYEKAQVEKQRYSSEITRWREKLAEGGDIDLLKSFEGGKFRQRIAADLSTSIEATKKKVSATKKSLSAEKESAPKN